jgi:hypothetical protein
MAQQRTHDRLRLVEHAAAQHDRMRLDRTS